MTLSDFALKRPVAATVLSLIIILLGFVGFNFLGVRLYPAIDPPIITVQASYTGANAEIIESQITEPLEKSINGIEGIKSVSSQSAVGQSSITVEFELGSDLEKAANDVRDKVSQAMRSLPQDMDATPTVTKADANGDPIIMLMARSSRMNTIELSDYAENILQEKLQTIPGVSSVQIFGQQKPAMRLWLNPAKMAAYQLTASDIRAALVRENVEMPGGKLRGGSTELLVKTRGRLETEADFNNMIVKQNDNQLVRLSDIGEAVLGPQNDESGAIINGTTGTMLALIPLPGANDIQIADEFYKRLEQIRQTIPSGMVLEIARDRSTFVRQSVKDVAETLGIAISLVVLIIFLFFRNWIIAIRPLIDIPVSLIGTFFIMYLAGFSINVLTLLGIVLATGLVVDDGIVVTENIFKKREQGMDKWKAAFEGTREILFAVISTSVTLAVVFLPIMFLEGFTGRLFREFGVVVAAAVLISALVSLTLTPVLNVVLGGGSSHHSKFYLATEPFFAGMESGYRKLLSFFFRNKWISFVVLGWCIVISLGLFGTLKTELAPLEDHSFIRTSVKAAEGMEYTATQNIVNQVALATMDSVPESRFVMTRFGGGMNSGSNSGSIMVFLKDPSDRKASQQDIYDRLTRMYGRVSNAKVMASQEQTISTSNSRGMPVQFVLQNLEFTKLQTILPKFLDEAQNSPVFSNVDVDLKFNKPELNITVDRLKANSMGVSEKDVSDALSSAFSGSRYGYFLRNNKQYYIIGQVDREDRDAPADLSSLYVPSKNGGMVQLDNVIKMEENSSPPILYHYNRYKSATVSANLAKGYTQGDGITEMQRIADKLTDDSFNTALAGSSRDFAESTSNILFSLLLALVLVYLILAAQFESFRDPFIIMLTVPMALAGALISLKIFGQTLNIFSEIGMILLIGIVTKNGILIVEFANNKRKAGLDKKTAAFEAASGRFRPILMTSLATMFGALPIALALGAGAESRVSMGIVIVCGLLFALMLTLFVIPVMYTMLTGKKFINPAIDMKHSLIYLLFFAVLTPSLMAQTTLSLEDVLDAALKNNFDIRISRSESQIAEANNTAGNAGMLPTISLIGSVGVNHANQRVESGGSVTSSVNSYVSGNASVQLNWTLYDGGKMFLTRQKLREVSSLGDIRFRETVLEKMYQVVEAYYDLVRLKQQLRSVRQTIRYNQERVTIAQAGFTAGSLSKPDLLQAKTDLNEVLESAITQEFAIREGQRYLNSLLARDTETLLQVGDSIPDEYQPNREELIQKLNASNVSLLAFQKQVEINRLALKETRSNYLPKFDVNANYEYSGQNKFNNAGSNSSLGPNVNGNLSIPIYQAGESNRKKRVAELTVESSQADLENLKLQLNLALQNALNDFDNQKALLKIEEENNLMTKEYLEISIQRLRLGQTNSLEVHLAQEKFMNSNTRLINFHYNLKLAETKLRQLVAAL